MKKPMLMLASCLLAGCATHEDFRSGGVVIGSQNYNEAHGIVITEQRVQYHDFVGHHGVRWFAYNPGSDPKCVNLRLHSFSNAASNHNGNYLVNPGSGRVFIGFAVSPSSYEVNADNTLTIWNPQNGQCLS